MLPGVASMSSPEQFEVHIRRVAVDGAAYSYSDFEQWYGAHAKQMWEGAAAAEHKRVAANGAAYTYADLVQWYGTLSRQMWEEAAATVHSPLDNITTDPATPTPAPAPCSPKHSSMATPKTKRGTATEHADVQAERGQNRMEAAQADLVDDERMGELACKLSDLFNLLLQALCCSDWYLSKDG